MAARGRPNQPRPRAASTGAVIAVASVLVLVATLLLSSVATAQEGSGQRVRLMHLPMRWCVLEGTTAAKRGANGAVLERIRRGSRILASKSGITLQSPFNSALGKAGGFPVIKDPRPNLGRLGDVVVPTQSTGEYRLVLDRCARAWDRLRSQLSDTVDLRGVARGPVSVIIRDFVDTGGRVYPSVWGYAFSASAAGSYCAAPFPDVRSASGGSLMVVDSADGHPSAQLDRRLIAHEVGHILRLGHGDGIDNPGSRRGVIDKFCDTTENPDQAGSLMTSSLRFENVEPWQRRLPRRLLEQHPAAVETQPVVRVRPKPIYLRYRERIGNGGSRVVRRTLRAPHSPMTPLEHAVSINVVGDDASDPIRDVQLPNGRVAPAYSDLGSIGIADDGTDGAVDIWFRPRALPSEDGEGATFFAAVDEDGDAASGAPADGAVVDLAGAWAKMAGLDYIMRVIIVAEEPEPRSEAWRWDVVAEAWQSVAPPLVTIMDSLGSEDARAEPSTVVARVEPGQLALSEQPRMAGLLRSRLPNGRVLVDSIPPRPGQAQTIAMNLEAADYPACAVNRDGVFPGVADPGGKATLEVFGFGVDAPVTMWLGDREQPVGRGDYWEIADDPWPWVAEVDIPLDAEQGLQMIQVQLEGTGMTADCALLVGGAEDDELFEFDL